MSCCASCGVKEGDDVKLKKCAACQLVKYCSIACQKQHRPKHKRDCKQRAAELRDEILFKQPESSYHGDCPICFLPHSLRVDLSAKSILPCCGKMICNGCKYANENRQIEAKLVPKCPFCRESLMKSERELAKSLKDRAEMNDPIAMRQFSVTYCEEGDFDNAFEYCSKAAALGDVGSHFLLAYLYCHGRGVEKDGAKEWYHIEQAAIGGHPIARRDLGVTEWNNRRVERAVKHWIIAAKLGHDDSLKLLRMAYEEGFASKDDFATALRGHQAAVDATKSPQRQAADEAFKQGDLLVHNFARTK